MERITPALNEVIVEEAKRECIQNETFSKKDFNKAYDKAIKNHGYSPSYFKARMRAIGPEYND
jgi:hypothetical protein